MRNTGKKLLQYLLQGVLVLAPVSITLYVITQVFIWLDNLIPIYLNVSNSPKEPFYLPGVGIAIIITALILVGWISSFFVVGRMLSMFDHLLEKTPGIKIIYTFVKDFSEAFAGRKRKFKNAVMVSIYQPDVYQLGFITNEEVEHFGLHDYITVYIPSSYAVAGTLFFVQRSRIRLLDDVSSPDALKFAISGGVVEVEEH